MTGWWCWSHSLSCLLGASEVFALSQRRRWREEEWRFDFFLKSIEGVGAGECRSLIGGVFAVLYGQAVGCCADFKEPLVYSLGSYIAVVKSRSRRGGCGHGSLLLQTG